MTDKLEEFVSKSTDKINNGNYKFFWQSGDAKFDNRWLALWYQKCTKSEFQFVSAELPQIRKNLADATIDMSYDYNLAYLKKLSKKYKYLQLFFSGGYDSVTVLDTALKNNIKIHETLSCIVGNVNADSNREINELAIPYLNQCRSKIDKITILHNSHKVLTEHFANPYRFFLGIGDTDFPPSFGSLSIGVEKRPYNPDSIYIQGADKPQLVFYNNKWFVCHFDTIINDCTDIPNMSFFWLDADNIKSLVKDARLYRDYLLTTTTPKNFLEFYKPNQDPNLNRVLGRSPVYNSKKLLKKGYGKKVDSKRYHRFVDSIDKNQYELLTNYFSCMNKFKEVLEIQDLNDLNPMNNKVKACWFIDIDTLEVFTPQELIPTGFQKNR